MIDATAAPSPAIARFGTEEPVVPPRILKAGVLEARLEAGNLRYIMIGGVEAIRGVAFLARDRNWGTYNARIEDLAVDERADGFTVSYRATVGDSAQSLSYTARIEGRADGSLTFTAEGAPDTDFVTNRTGFVVLHPLDGVIDHPVRIEHTDGSIEESRFPVEVNPACPFENIRAMTHEILPGVSLTCRMEGDAYEMEDHRNWLDASFKTYIRPLAKPWPYTMGEGEAFKQSVTITLEGEVPAATGGTGGPVTVTLGAATGTEVPRFGLAVPAAWTTAALERADLVAAAKPSFLVCHFDPRAGHDRSTIAEYAALGDAVGAPLVLEAVVLRHAEDGLTELGAGGLTLVVPRLDAAPGTAMRLRIAAHDVILSREAPVGLSALNILPGTIQDIRSGDGPGALVSLDTAAGRVLARITRRSAQVMGLEPGQVCHAVVKSVAVAPDDVGGGPGMSGLRGPGST